MAAHRALSAFWFLYMGAMGIFYPFLALYLKENAGLSGSEVGVVLAVFPLVSMVAPTAWGIVADRTGAATRVLGGVTLVASIAQAALSTLEGFPALVAGAAVLAAFSTAILPLGISVSLAALGPDGSSRFGRVRVWGTVGYLVCVVGYPWMLDRFEPAVPPVPAGAVSEPALGSLFAAAAGLGILAAATTLALPRAGAVPISVARREWLDLHRHPPVAGILVFSFLAYLFLQGPMSLFPVYLRARGGDLDTLSRMWVVMLLPEIPLIALSGAGLRRFGARTLLAVGTLAGGLRWLVCGLSQDLAVVYAVQALHGVVVAGVLVGSPLYLEAALSDRLRSTGQGLLAMAGVGIGGIASNMITGWLFERLGPDAPYVIGGAGALVLGVALPAILPPPSRPSEPHLRSPRG